MAGFWEFGAPNSTTEKCQMSFKNNYFNEYPQGTVFPSV